MSNANLTENTSFIFSDAMREVLPNDKTLSFSPSALQDAINEHVSSYADSAVIYTHDALEIINRYDSQVAEVEDYGQTFTALEWEKAMTAYAYCVAEAYMTHQTNDLFTDLFDEAHELLAFAHEHGASDELTVEDIKATDSSVFGWESHKLEDAEGRCYWRKVEGEIDAVESTFQGFTLYLSWPSK